MYPGCTVTSTPLFPRDVLEWGRCTSGLGVEVLKKFNRAHSLSSTTSPWPPRTPQQPQGDHASAAVARHRTRHLLPKTATVIRATIRQRRRWTWTRPPAPGHRSQHHLRRALTRTPRKARTARTPTLTKTRTRTQMSQLPSAPPRQRPRWNDLGNPLSRRRRRRATYPRSSPQRRGRRMTAAPALSECTWRRWLRGSVETWKHCVHRILLSVPADCSCSLTRWPPASTFSLNPTAVRAWTRWA